MMPSADAWLAMCQPSAKRAMEPKIMPEMISTAMVAKVSHITSQVRRSLRFWSPGEKIMPVGAGEAFPLCVIRMFRCLLRHNFQHYPALKCNYQGDAIIIV